MDVVHARVTDRKALNEHESKRLFAECGIPIVEEQVAFSVETAAQIADTLGYLVALEALGARLPHKADRGLVFAFVSSKEQLEKAGGSILQEVGGDLDGFWFSCMSGFIESL